MRYVLSSELTAKAYHDMKALASLCENYDGIIMKLELDSKPIITGEPKTLELNYEYAIEAYKAVGKEEQQLYREFFCYDGDRVVGYIGISIYGSGPMEASGLVHPDYRKRGIFGSLFKMVEITWIALNRRELLLITDQRSEAGMNFTKKLDGKYSHTEFNMVLVKDFHKIEAHDILLFKRATNKDAAEIAYQNSLYFCINYDESDMPMPETEALRGIDIFMIEYQGQLIGKVHLQMIEGQGHIYGLGLLPRFRGYGYGKMILEKSVNELVHKGAKMIRLEVAAENDTALSLYKSIGFKIENAMIYYRFLKEDYVD